MGLFTDGEHRLCCHHCLRPWNKLAIPMLAHHIGMHIAGIYMEIGPEQIAQPGSVERGACAQNTTGIKP